MRSPIHPASTSRLPSSTIGLDLSEPAHVPVPDHEHYQGPHANRAEPPMGQTIGFRRSTHSHLIAAGACYEFIWNRRPGRFLPRDHHPPDLKARRVGPARPPHPPSRSFNNHHDAAGRTPRTTKIRDWRSPLCDHIHGGECFLRHAVAISSRAAVLRVRPLEAPFVCRQKFINLGLRSPASALRNYPGAVSLHHLLTPFAPTLRALRHDATLSN